MQKSEMLEIQDMSFYFSLTQRNSIEYFWLER